MNIPNWKSAPYRHSEFVCVIGNRRHAFSSEFGPSLFAMAKFPIGFNKAGEFDRAYLHDQRSIDYQPGHCRLVHYNLGHFPGNVSTRDIAGDRRQTLRDPIRKPRIPVLTEQGVPHARFFVQFDLDDEDLASRLPPGASGAAAIYSSHGVQQTAMIRKVAIRFYTYFNYILPDG